MTPRALAARALLLLPLLPSGCAGGDEAELGHGGFVINCNHNGRHCGGGGLAPSIWTFFKAHPYGAGKPWSSLPAGFNSACKIY